MTSLNVTDDDYDDDMDDHDIQVGEMSLRLECLKVAARLNPTSVEVLMFDASKLYTYLLNGS